MYNLTNKEIIELRLKCLEMFVTIASKANIEQDVVFAKARTAWGFAIEGLKADAAETPRAENKQPGIQSKKL